jgi:DNA-directed RNA polymerase subunit omega
VKIETDKSAEVKADIKCEIPKMIDELKSEKLVNKVGGKFKLTALVQKRLGELMQGGRPLIKDTQGKTMLEIVIQEILQDKIAIDDGVSPEPAEKIKKK